MKHEHISTNKPEGIKVEDSDGKERVISKGEARYDAISKTISTAGSRMSSWIKGGVLKFGKFLKARAIGALEAPEDIASGAKLVKDKAIEGKEFVGKKIDQGGEWVDKKVGQAGEWVGYNAVSAYDYSSERYNEAKNFVNTKVEKAGNYLKDKALLAEAVGSLIKEKTTEKLNIAGEGIKNTYNKAVEYGKGAVDSASLKCQQAKESFNKKKNAMIEAVLVRKAEIQAEKLQKTLAKLSQYRKVEELGNKMAA